MTSEEYNCVHYYYYYCHYSAASHVLRLIATRVALVVVCVSVRVSVCLSVCVLGTLVNNYANTTETTEMPGVGSRTIQLDISSFDGRAH